MYSLLEANASRLKRNRIFILSMLFMVFIGVLFPLVTYQEMLQVNTVYHLQERAFWYPVFIGIILAIFCSLFLGTENSDNTIRNKIIIGHSRVAVYLSNLLICMIAVFFMCVVHTLTVIAVGTPLLGFYTMNTYDVIGYTVAIITMAFVFAAIYTLISMNFQSKASIAVVCILLWLCLLFVSFYIQNKLMAPEFSNEGVPNTEYLSGRVRDIYLFLSEFLPTGQTILFMRCEAVHWLQMTVYNVISASILSILGIFFFKRRDLK